MCLLLKLVIDVTKKTPLSMSLSTLESLSSESEESASLEETRFGLSPSFISTLLTKEEILLLILYLLDTFESKLFDSTKGVSSSTILGVSDCWLDSIPL